MLIYQRRIGKFGVGLGSSARNGMLSSVVIWRVSILVREVRGLCQLNCSVAQDNTPSG